MSQEIGAALRRLASAPDTAAAWHDAAVALDRGGRDEDARAAWAQAHRLAPGDAAIAAGLAQADVESGLRRLLVHEPARLAARLRLARLLRARHRPSAARDVLRAVPSGQEDDAALLSARAVTELELGHQDEARRLAERAVAQEPEAASFHQLLCTIMAYQDGVSGAELTACLQRAAALWPRAPHPPAPRADPGRRLRLGILGGAFRRHPSTWLTLPAFEHLDRDAFEIHCFAVQSIDDVFTARWKAIAEAWHEASQDDHAAIAARIRGAGIDILIDLGGALENGRLPVLALRPAPVQVKWAGGQYHTTGFAEVDAFITDAFETPPELAHLYRERLIVMPGSYVCYDPPRDAPGVAAPRGERAITFASFNNLMKITPRVLDTWCAILRQLPDARLLMKTQQLDEQAVRDAMLAAFASRDIASSRIDLSGESDHAGVLAAYGAVDIALQPFPYCGGVTLLEGLFMGVPAIALAGETFAARHGVSHLSNVGLADCIAGTADDYIARAVTLASARPRLALLRAQLRDRLLNSPICDAPAFARSFGAALRGLHRAA
jgi:predicted O-linked N-acetylglucosamine transferase (SPINDLY family)